MAPSRHQNSAPIGGLWLSEADICAVCWPDEAPRRVCVLRHWRRGVDWIETDSGIALKVTALTDYVGELATTGQREAALRLMRWLGEWADARRECDVAPAPAVGSVSRARAAWYREGQFA